jgi:Fe-S cluster assembly protein SufD
MSTIKVNPEYAIPDLAPELERGPQWLRDRRREAMSSFNNAPLPRRGLHLWRYTDPVKFMVEQTGDAVAPSAAFRLVANIEKNHLAEGHLAGLVTDFAGREIEAYQSDELRSQGVVLCSLSDAAESHRELVEKYLYELIGARTGKFEALNGALWNDGIFVFVPDNTTIERPIHLIREAGTAGSAQYPRLLAIVGKNSEATIIDEYGGGSTDAEAGNSYSNAAVEIFGLEESRTRYVALQRQAGAMNSYLTHRARIDRGANMMTIPVVLGGSISKQNFGIILNGDGAESNIYGLLFGAEHRQYDNHTLQHHCSGHTRSTIDFKVVLRDRAVSAYTGLIRIEEQAPGCEAYQENRNLLLNSGVRAEAIPELEILNDDVSCSHGATIGPIDPEMLFLLRSRGITEEEAVRMIVTGFMTKTLGHMPEDLRARVAQYLVDRLEGC